MKTISGNKKTSHAMLAGLALALGVHAVTGHAVNIATDGSGQVLIYPYYTVRNGFVTSITVQNTDTRHTKALKMRFLEGKAGAAVLSFNVFLPPRDIWSASIVERNFGASIFTADRSCTSPPVPQTQATAFNFANFFYTGQVVGTFADNAGTGLDRTREGYVEIIEMGVLANGADAASSPATATGTNVAAAVAPTAGGAPANCSSVQVNDLLVNGVDILRPSGGLSGSYIIINAATGTEFAHKAVALQNFYTPAVGNTALYTNSGSLLPDLGSVSPARSAVLATSTNGGGEVFTVTDWVAEGGRPIDAVSAVLMHSSISAEYDASADFKTDIVVTLPTKPFYVAAANGGAAASAPVAASGPFTGTFASASAGGARSCDRTVGRTYDRQGAPIAAAWEPGQTGPDLCWTSNVLTVTGQVQTQAAASVFGSANAVLVRAELAAGSLSIWPTRADGSAITSGPGQAVTASGATAPPVVTNEGSAGLRSLAPGGTRYRGLPMVGFAAIQALIGGQGYGGIFDTKRDTSIAP